MLQRQSVVQNGGQILFKIIFHTCIVESFTTENGNAGLNYAIESYKNISSIIANQKVEINYWRRLLKYIKCQKLFQFCYKRELSVNRNLYKFESSCNTNSLFNETLHFTKNLKDKGKADFLCKLLYKTVYNWHLTKHTKLPITKFLRYFGEMEANTFYLDLQIWIHS